MENNDIIDNNQNSSSKKLKLSQNTGNGSEDQEQGGEEENDDASDNDNETKIKLPDDIASYIECVNQKLLLRDSLSGPSDFLFKRMNSKTLVQTNNVKIKEKTTQHIYNASTLKVHPCHSPNVHSFEPNISIKLDPDQQVNVFSTDIPSNVILIDHARYQYFLGFLDLIAESINKKDLVGFETLIEDAFVEDCKFKNPALKNPVIGRHYILELLRSFFRVSNNLNISVCNVDEAELDGSYVLTSSYNASGLSKYMYIYKRVRSLESC